MLKHYLFNGFFYYFHYINYFTIFTMKIFTNILIVLAVALIIFNITLLDFGNLFTGDSLIGLIGIVASFCAVCILLIFRMSKAIEEKSKN